MINIKSLITLFLLTLTLSPTASASPVIKPFPELPNAFASDRFRLQVDGEPLIVYKFKDIHYAHLPHPASGAAAIQVNSRRHFTAASLSPKSYGIPTEVDVEARIIRFNLDRPRKVVLTLNDSDRLFLFSEPPVDAPDTENTISVLDHGADPTGLTLSTAAIQQAINAAPAGATILVPPGGYLIGSLFLKSDITLHLEAGAILKASPDLADFEQTDKTLISIRNAENVTLTGYGALDGSGVFLRTTFGGGSGRLIAIRDSKHVTVDGLLLRDPRSWNTHIIRSEHVTFRNVKLLNDRNNFNTDGINPDSSRHVLIEDSFFYCGDDPVAVKSSAYFGRPENVHDITVRNNIILTKKSALKVGTETHAAEMKDITFINNDVIEADRGMAIYSRDGAHVHDVSYINNRFEQHYPDYQQRMIYFVVSERNGRGRISDILIKDCTVNQAFPLKSTITGLAEDHAISNVRFVNYRYAGKLAKTPADAHLELRDHTANITFEVTE